MPAVKNIRSLKDILAVAKKLPGNKTLALIAADQEEGLKCVDDAFQNGIIKPLLVGDKAKITKLARSLKISLRGMDILDEPDPKAATLKVVAMCRSGEVDILMKGSVNTDVVLRAVLDREKGIGLGKLLSNVTAFDSPTHKRLMFLTDPAVNINPDASRKVEMIRNAIWVANRLGFKRPKIALLAAVEKINPKDMPCTADAAIIAKMAESGQINGAEIAGPYALDLALSKHAAECKNVTGPVAGCADVLVCPDIHSANILYKSLVYFSNVHVANAMVGVKAPIVMSSRSDSKLTKLYTMALSVMLAGEQQA